MSEWIKVKGHTGKHRAELHTDGAVHPSPWFDTEAEAQEWIDGHDKRQAGQVAEAKKFAKANGYEDSKIEGHWFDPRTNSHVGVARLLELALHQR